MTFESHTYNIMTNEKKPTEPTSSRSTRLKS